MNDRPSGRRRTLDATLRTAATVTPLELFFDLVFVLAITQATGHAAHTVSWTGLAESILALAALWWAWCGYSWLTSVIDPEEGAVRLLMFAAMAAMLVAALGLAGAFGDDRFVFVAAYGLVRLLHIGLFVIASRSDAALRSSVLGLAGSSMIGVALLGAAAAIDGPMRYVLWASALLLDIGGPFVFGAAGWRLEPHHFAERHGLVVLIALGESIVATGAGLESGLTGAEIAVAVIGVAVAAGMWWTYFDVIAIGAARRLAELAPGLPQNELARDAYTYLHLPMVGGIVGVAVGMKLTLGDVEAELPLEATVAMFGGAAIYLIALAAWRRRTFGRWSPQRLVAAGVLAAATAPATDVAGPWALTSVAVVLWGLIAYEATRFGALRHEVRHQPG